MNGGNEGNHLPIRLIKKSCDEKGDDKGCDEKKIEGKKKIEGGKKQGA